MGRCCSLPPDNRPTILRRRAHQQHDKLYLPGATSNNPATLRSHANGPHPNHAGPWSGTPRRSPRQRCGRISCAAAREHLCAAILSRKYPLPDDPPASNLRRRGCGASPGPCAKRGRAKCFNNNIMKPVSRSAYCWVSIFNFASRLLASAFPSAAALLYHCQATSRSGSRPAIGIVFRNSGS
jgi:hypothetical protein